MSLSRRDFLLSAAAGAFSGLSAYTWESAAAAQDQPVGFDDWAAVRAQFDLDPGYIHLAGLLLASHPRPVREAIEQYRQALNENPARYLSENNTNLENAVRRAAADYLGVQPEDIALTESTTMGIALVYNGVQVREDQELLTAEFDYYSTHESLKFKAERSGAVVRKVALYESIHSVSADEIVDRLIEAIDAKTRVLAATWVHSSTGLKLPLSRIAEALTDINAGRDEADRVLFCVDGVHGLGVEDATLDQLGCDFFMAGTHKWLFAPRGTGIIWGRPQSQHAVTPTIPTFSVTPGWGSWMTPGGFKAFEHRWVLTEAFEFHQQLGKARVAARIHALNRKLKEGLAELSHVTLYTPMDENLSAGITCFDIDGLTPSQVVRRLRQKNIIASDTPYDPSYARLTPTVFNTSEEIEQTLRAIRDLA